MPTPPDHAPCPLPPPATKCRTPHHGKTMPPRDGRNRWNRSETRRHQKIFPSRQKNFPSREKIFPSRERFFPSRGRFFPSRGNFCRCLADCDTRYHPHPQTVCSIATSHRKPRTSEPFFQPPATHKPRYKKRAATPALHTEKSLHHLNTSRTLPPPTNRHKKTSPCLRP